MSLFFFTGNLLLIKSLISKKAERIFILKSKGGK